MAYEGPERRVHRVFVTRNTEYHMRHQQCVGVRDRESGEWLRGHFALERTVCGSLRFFESGAMTASPGLPRVGESMYFEDHGRDLVTSAIVSVERPRPEVVDDYPS
ncbi:MAG: hypothetical protein OXU20_37505 [Myxococcales bacterium]|nr:hypothetical protein [Myxococcales bacterium]MDD9966122.1 hypothetical protein [Myxococcales bacterium]